MVLFFYLNCWLYRSKEYTIRDKIHIALKLVFWFKFQYCFHQTIQFPHMDQVLEIFLPHVNTHSSSRAIKWYPNPVVTKTLVMKCSNTGTPVTVMSLRYYVSTVGNMQHLIPIRKYSHFEKPLSLFSSSQARRVYFY